MKEAHHCFKQPKDRNSKLWRYMNLTRFLDLIQSRSLYFTRAGLLNDPFEGSNTHSSSARGKELIDLRNSGQLSSEDFYFGVSDEAIEYFFSQREKSNRDFVNRYLVSCWHSNEYESAAMWKLYSQGEPIVAIQTTYDLLDSILPKFFYLGEVSYIDYGSEKIPEDNVFYPIMHKRKSFEHEKEVRAVTLDFTDFNPPSGIYAQKSGARLPVDINKLIQKIIIDPTAEDWIRNVIHELTKTYNIDSKIEKSALDILPVY